MLTFAQNRFVRLIKNSKLPEDRKSPTYNIAIRQLHAAILGVCALVDSYPYTIERWMPELLTSVLAEHTYDPVSGYGTCIMTRMLTETRRSQSRRQSGSALARLGRHIKIPGTKIRRSSPKINSPRSPLCSPARPIVRVNLVRAFERLLTLLLSRRVMITCRDTIYSDCVVNHPSTCSISCPTIIASYEMSSETRKFARNPSMNYTADS